MPSDIGEAIARLEECDVLTAVRGRAEAGEDPLMLIEQCREGMELVGRLFQSGDYYLGELIISAQIFREAMAILEPMMKAGTSPKTIGRVVLGTPRGDIHDIGKNIVGLLLKAAGFEVIDLGVDVPPERFLRAVREQQAEIVGLSGLITPAFEGMKRVVDRLIAAGLRDRVKVIIGGGITNEAARRYVGADAQATDAVSGVERCKSWVDGASPSQLAGP